MEWYGVLALVIGSLLALLASGLQVALAFFLIDIVGLYFLVGGWPAVRLLPGSILDSVMSFQLSAVPMFVLMGELLYHSGVADRLLNAVEKWVGGVAGRLSQVTVFTAAAFGAVSGSAMAATATLGATLGTEMKRRGYSVDLSAGPIIGAGGLAMIIPPSSIAVLLGTIGNISIAKLLIGGIVPGVLIALGYSAMIALRVKLNPRLMPDEPYQPPTWRERFRTLTVLFPVGLIIFLVLGLIFTGVATPSESAATGAFGALLLCLFYRRLNWEVLKKSVTETVKITGGIFFIMGASAAFSQLLSFTGLTRGLVNLVQGLPWPPLAIVSMMMVVYLVMGMFMDQMSMMLITLPVFMPIIHALGLDPVWFGILVLIAMEIGNETPPFGMQLFIGQSFFHGVAYKDIVRAVFPFIIVDVAVLFVLMFFPRLALWLPSMVLK